MATKKWVIDPMHTEIRFKIKHLMISNVTGSFNQFEGGAETEGNDFTTAKINFTAQVSSIDTGNEQRDGHLKTGDFFETEKYPQLSFVSTGIEKSGSDDYVLHGDLTLRGVTKPITLQVEGGGVAKDPYGNTKVGFTVSGKIHRADYGLSYNAAIETGGVLLGEDVKVDCEVQLAEQA